MEMHQLRYFVAVAEERHFGRAAARENIAQPPLSQQIRKLEREIGAQLFYRTRRFVKITEAGSALLPTARHILQAAKEGKTLAQRAHRGEFGRLVLGFVHSASITYLPKLIGPFRAKNPGIEIAFVEMTVSEQLEALARGVIDIGVARPPVDEAELISWSVQKEPFCIAVPAESTLAAKVSAKMADLRDEQVVFYPRHRSPAFHDQLLRLFTSSGIAPRVGVEANTMYTAIGLVGTGAGIAIVPRSFSSIDLPSVKYLTLENTDETAELHLVHRKDTSNPSALNLIAFAKSQSLMENSI